MIHCETKTWDDRILKLLGLSPALFSDPVLPGKDLGLISSRYKMKMPAKIIAVAGHDTACAVAAIPFANQNSAFLSTGTWCILGWLSEKPLLSEDARHMGITNELAANGMFRPVKNLMGLWLIQQLRISFGSKHCYDEIDRMAEKEKASKFLVDPSDPVFYHPENMKTAFDVYFQKNEQPLPLSEAGYYRCAYDSLVASFRKTLLDFEALRGTPFDVVHLIGGGSQSALLCQLTANAFQKKVLAGPVEGAVTGNLLIQYEAWCQENPDLMAMPSLKNCEALRTYLPQPGE